MAQLNSVSRIAVDSSTFDALAELGRNTPDEIKQMRSHARMTVRAKVTAQPGNASAREKEKFSGVTGDVSNGGCPVLFPVPVTVGDIYWLTFDRSTLSIDPLLARCVRCRLIRENAYEAGFSFFEVIELAPPDPTPDNNLL